MLAHTGIPLFQSTLTYRRKQIENNYQTSSFVKNLPDDSYMVSFYREFKIVHNVQELCLHITSDKHLCRNAKHIHLSAFFSNKDIHKIIPSCVCTYAFISSKHLASWSFSSWKSLISEKIPDNIQTFHSVFTLQFYHVFKKQLQ